MWIYEHSDWPAFTWKDDQLAFRLAAIRHRQGYLLGRMAEMGFDLKGEASLDILTRDVVTSSAIEGEVLSSEEVRSSIARRLGMDIAGLVPASRHVDGVVEMMLDATQHFAMSLTKERLFDWHAALFPTGRSGMHRITVAAWRGAEAGPMQVISGPPGREKVHFQAPEAVCLDKEMQVFLDWFNGDGPLDPVLKAGIAHFWFVTIHPFEDGNGRIARAIADMALARADAVPDRFYSLSSRIAARRKDYYAQLEKQQRGTPDLTSWLIWFLDCLDEALSHAQEVLAGVLYKARLWAVINQRPVNARQRSIINRMLESDFEGHMNTSKYAKIAKCSNDTALRDIQDLQRRGIFIQNPGRGRSTSYRLPDRPDINA